MASHIMHNAAVCIRRRLRTTMPPCAFGADVDSICAALTANRRDSLTGKPPEPAQQSREIPSRVWGTPQQTRLGRRHTNPSPALSHALCLHEAGPKSNLIA
jgi:hypothetical protein